MPEWILYLLKVNAAIALFYLGYYFFLKKVTFYQLNRCYLMLGLLYSALYPLFDISKLFNRHQYLQQSTLPLMSWDDLVSTVPPKTDVWDVLFIVFVIGITLLVIRLVLRLVSLKNIHGKSVAAIYQFYNYRKITLKIDPFSFWKSIYVNPSLHSANDLSEIFKHESVHVQDLHTIDVLLAEIASICCWFNPAIWFMRLAIKENLEFLTDSKVIKSGVDKKSYQYSLVNLSTQHSASAISNHFNFNALKKRIFMMNKKKSSRLNLGKYVFLVPAISLFVMAFTVSRAYQSQSSTNNSSSADSTQKQGLAGNSMGFVIDGYKNDGTQDTSKKKKKNVLIKANSGTDAKPLYIVDGTPLEDGSDMNHLNPENIKSIEVLKGTSASAVYGAKGKNGVIIVTTKDGSTNPNAGQASTVKGSTGLKSDLDSLSKEQDAFKAIVSEKDGKSLVSSIPKEVIYIIDGKVSDEATVEKLSQEDIEAVDVKKENKMKGTIHITTKKKK